MKKVLLVAGLLTGSVLAGMPAVALAAPVIVGNGGNDTVPDGSIPIPPSGDTTVQYVSTNGGIEGVGANPDGSSYAPTDGSTFTTDTFTPGVGGSLSFNFDYISSDGTGGEGSFPDNAWADLINSTTGNVAAVLFSSTTTSFTPQPGTTASVLGSWSGQCYGDGCGNTGWQSAGYSFTDDDTYDLEFGVVNSRDTLYNSALFFDGAEENGHPIVPTPEPAAFGVFGIALAGLVVARRRRNG